MRFVREYFPTDCYLFRDFKKGSECRGQRVRQREQYHYLFPGWFETAWIFLTSISSYKGILDVVRPTPTSPMTIHVARTSRVPPFQEKMMIFKQTAPPPETFLSDACTPLNGTSMQFSYSAFEATTAVPVRDAKDPLRHGNA